VLRRAEARRSRLGSLRIAAGRLDQSLLMALRTRRHRPVIEGHPPLGPAPNELSFPSAHATSAVAAATALGRVAPRARPALYALAGLICLGRPYLGMHYPSDVLAGVALGYGIGRIWPLPPEADAEEAPR